MSKVKSLPFLAAATAALLAALVLSAPADAHTEFDRSVPGDGATVRGPVDRIQLIYTNEATEAAEGFVVLDPERGRIRADSVVERGTGTFVLGFDEPLSAGEVGVRWTVRAPDAHPISGSFSFTVRGGGGAGAGGAGGPGLEEFLAEDSGSAVGEVVARAGRAVTFIGLAAALGLTVFGFAVFRGSGRELRTMVGWIRLGGLLIVLGTVVDATGQVMVESGGVLGPFDPGAWVDTLGTSLGVAWVLRLVGGSLVVVGAGGQVAALSRPHADPIRAVVQTVPSVSAAPEAAARGADPERDDRRLRMERSTLPLVAGLGLLLLAAHSFDGHTVNEGSRVLMSAAAAVHVLVGSIWAGGIVALALIVRNRMRRGEPTGGLMLAARFSVLAGASLALVTVVGTYLGVVILDSLNELWLTDWGRVLIAKVAIVAAAAGLGAYNHFRLIPEVEASGRGGAAEARLSRSLWSEAGLMATVVALSAILVRASSVA